MKKLLQSPKHRFISAAVMLALLPIAGAAQGVSAPTLARGLLALAALAGLGWWFLRARRSGHRFTAPERMFVVQRIALAQRTGATLVEVDGQSLLIVHGEGYARLQRIGKQLKPPVLLQRRRTTDKVRALHGTRWGGTP